MESGRLHTLWSALFGLLLVCWPVLDTEATGAVTPLRIGLAGGMLLLFVGAWAMGGRTVQVEAWNPTDRVLLAGAVWYVANVLFIARGEADLYSLLTAFVFGVAYLFCRRVGTGFVLPAMLLSGLVQAAVVTAQLGGWLASRHAYYDLTGSFSNPGPLGGWLCVALLAALVLTVQNWKNRKPLLAAFCIVCGLYIGSILILTDSRAAWLGSATGIFIGILLYLPPSRNKRLLLCGLSMVGIIGVGLLYNYKKASADGRLLIWRVSAELFAQKPILGHGVGSFQERYMFAQANYLEHHPDSPFIQVADQTKYPFNELIGAACDTGIVGAGLLVGLLGTAFARRRRDTPRKILLAGLVIFGLLSYPSQFLSFSLLLTALLADDKTEGPALRQRKWHDVLLDGGLLGIGVGVLIYIAAAEQAGRSRHAMLLEAATLMQQNNPASLPRLESLAKRLPVASLYVDLGDFCLTSAAPAKARAYYIQASRMIPSRLRPYDGLFRLYRTSGQTDSATLMARRILTLPVKVSNTTTLRLRREAREWLREQE